MSETTNAYGEEVDFISGTHDVWYLIEPEVAGENEYFVMSGGEKVPASNGGRRYAAKSHARKAVRLAYSSDREGNVRYYLDGKGAYDNKWVHGSFLTKELRPRIGKRDINNIERELRAFMAEKLNA